MSATLITGADGHLGRALASWLLRNSAGELLLYVRAGDETERAEKHHSLGELAADARCRVIFGDLREDQPFAKIGRDGLARIIHCAAVTDFGVERDVAMAVNVEGTRKLVEFAAECPDLQRFVLLSSLYAAGLVNGDIAEAPFPQAAAFANHYEWSKWQAENMLYARHDIPWQIFRIATLLCEDGTGDVRQQNVIHNTLRLLYYGLLSVIPGNPETRVNMTTTAFAVDAVCRLLVEGDDRTCYNISDSGADAQTLGQLVETVYECFQSDEQFAQKRILKPLFCDETSFATLVTGMDQLGGTIAQALGSIAPFAAQLFHDKNVHTDRVRSALPHGDTGDMTALMRSTADRLAASRWGLQDRKRSAA